MACPLVMKMMVVVGAVTSQISQHALLWLPFCLLNRRQRRGGPPKYRWRQQERYNTYSTYTKNTLCIRKTSFLFKQWSDSSGKIKTA